MSIKVQNRNFTPPPCSQHQTTDRNSQKHQHIVSTHLVCAGKGKKWHCLFVQHRHQHGVRNATTTLTVHYTRYRFRSEHSCTYNTHSTLTTKHDALGLKVARRPVSTKWLAVRMNRHFQTALPSGAHPIERTRSANGPTATTRGASKRTVFYSVRSAWLPVLVCTRQPVQPLGSIPDRTSSVMDINDLFSFAFHLHAAAAASTTHILRAQPPQQP